MTAAPSSTPTHGAPKLLFDANVFRDLAVGRFPQYEQRLMRASECRTPPLFWACPLTFEELVCHVREEEADRFPLFRASLEWMDRLCRNGGMAEDLPWVLRALVFIEPQPYDNRSLSMALNKIRRQLIKLQSFKEIPAALLAAIEKTRTEYKERSTAWKQGQAQIVQSAREPLKPGERGVEDSVVVPKMLLDISRGIAAKVAPDWGPMKSEQQQTIDQREVVAFEIERLRKQKSRNGYNVDKHEHDYNDSWLLPYLAVGYTLVTEDGVLRRALLQGGCKDPRVVNLIEGLDLAEGWLRSF